MLVARFIDAADAPVWGIVFERTRSRWGRIRPWFFWLCGPFALFGILTFVTPEDVGANTKILYAAGTYIIVNILYTGINTPVTAILAVLTTDPRGAGGADVLPHGGLQTRRAARQSVGDEARGLAGRGRRPQRLPAHGADLCRRRRRAVPARLPQPQGSRPHREQGPTAAHRFRRAARQLAMVDHRGEQRAVLDRLHRAGVGRALFLRIHAATPGPGSTRLRARLHLARVRCSVCPGCAGSGRSAPSGPPVLPG